MINWIKAIALVCGGMGGFIANLHFYPQETLMVIFILGLLAVLSLFIYTIKEILDD
jgi:hypothetical protein